MTVANSLEDLRNSYLGEFVVLDDSVDLEKLEEDEELRSLLNSLGTVIATSNKLEELRGINIPTVEISKSQIKNLQNKLQTGQEVTVDFKNGKIYKGEVRTRVVLSEKPSQIKVIEKDKKIDFNSLKFDESFKVSDFYVSEGKHPLTNQRASQGEDFMDRLKASNSSKSRLKKIKFLFTKH